MTVFGVPLVSFLRELMEKSNGDNVFNGAAALAFYLTLALFPAMILTMSIIPYLPIADVDRAIMDLLGQVLPNEAYQMVSQVVDQVMQERGGLLSLGILATLWATSGGMYAVMRQLNITYEVTEARKFIHARAVALGLSLMFCGLILVAFSLVVLGGTAQEWIGRQFGFSAALLAFFAALRWLIIVFTLMLAFSLTYYFAPNAKDRQFALITPGGAVATILLMIASLGFTIYVQNFANYDAVYGSIGAVILLMLWLYIAGLALLVGSEINVVARRHGASPQRTGHAHKRHGNGSRHSHA